MKKKQQTADDIRDLVRHDLEGAFAHLKAAAENMKRLAGLDADKPEPEKRKTRQRKAAMPKKPEAKAEEATPVVANRRTPKSVRLMPHEITMNFGAFPVKQLAENDAKDFLNNPNIFWYRPIQFPDPRRYQVQPRVEHVNVVKRESEKFSNAPWTCSVTIAIIGDDKRCKNWGEGVYTKNRANQE